MRSAEWARPIVFVVAATTICNATLFALAEKPTREAIIAYNDQCEQAGEAADFIARFGTEFSDLDLSGVSFRGAHTVGMESNLRGADFTGANLRGADFGAAICDGVIFRDANLQDASFVTASLRGVELRGAVLDGTSIYQSDLDDARAEGVDFSGASITGSHFPGAKLSGSTFAGANSEYWWCNFARADLANADLHGVALNGASFRHANLAGADLSNCQLEEADFTGADLPNTRFDGAQVKAAIFRDVRGMNKAELVKLRSQAGRSMFELTRGTKAFFDSLAFPIVLLIGIPVAAVIVRALAGRKRADPANESPRRFQFSLGSLLLLTLIAATFVGVGMWSGTGLYSLTMVCAFYLMVAQIIWDKKYRRLASGMLAAALLYPVANVLMFFCAGPYGILDLAFILAAIFICPLLLLAAGESIAISHGLRHGRCPWLVGIGFGVWMLGIGFANMWIIGQVLASV